MINARLSGGESRGIDGVPDSLLARIISPENFEDPYTKEIANQIYSTKTQTAFLKWLESDLAHSENESVMAWRVLTFFKPSDSAQIRVIRPFLTHHDEPVKKAAFNAMITYYQKLREGDDVRDDAVTLLFQQMLNDSGEKVRIEAINGLMAYSGAVELYYVIKRRVADLSVNSKDTQEYKHLIELFDKIKDTKKD
jgi:hypothetical protein